MKRKLNIAITMALALCLINCSNLKNKDKGNSGGDPIPPKKFTSSNAAAEAAKNDMMEAIEKGIDFGVDREKLKAASLAEPVETYSVPMENLMNSDTGSTLDKMASAEKTMIVPLVNNSEVITVVKVNRIDDQFGINGLGDAFFTKELNLLSKIGGDGKSSWTVMEVTNLSAFIYRRDGPNGPEYRTSYSGRNLREPMPENELIRMLRADALSFQKRLGDKLKKQELVK